MLLTSFGLFCLILTLLGNLVQGATFNVKCPVGHHVNKITIFTTSTGATSHLIFECSDFSQFTVGDISNSNPTICNTGPLNRLSGDSNSKTTTIPCNGANLIVENVYINFVLPNGEYLSEATFDEPGKGNDITFKEFIGAAPMRFSLNCSTYIDQIVEHFDSSQRKVAVSAKCQYSNNFLFLGPNTTSINQKTCIVVSSNNNDQGITFNCIDGPQIFFKRDQSLTLSPLTARAGYVSYMTGFFLESAIIDSIKYTSYFSIKNFIPFDMSRAGFYNHHLSNLNNYIDIQTLLTDDFIININNPDENYICFIKRKEAICVTQFKKSELGNISVVIQNSLPESLPNMLNLTIPMSFTSSINTAMTLDNISYRVIIPTDPLVFTPRQQIYGSQFNTKNYSCGDVKILNGISNGNLICNASELDGQDNYFKNLWDAEKTCESSSNQLVIKTEAYPSKFQVECSRTSYGGGSRGFLYCFQGQLATGFQVIWSEKNELVRFSLICRNNPLLNRHKSTTSTTTSSKSTTTASFASLNTSKFTTTTAMTTTSKSTTTASFASLNTSKFTTTTATTTTSKSTLTSTSTASTSTISSTFTIEETVIFSSSSSLSSSETINLDITSTSKQESTTLNRDSITIHLASSLTTTFSNLQSPTIEISATSAASLNEYTNTLVLYAGIAGGGTALLLVGGYLVFLVYRKMRNNSRSRKAVQRISIAYGGPMSPDSAGSRQQLFLGQNTSHPQVLFGQGPSFSPSNQGMPNSPGNFAMKQMMMMMPTPPISVKPPVSYVSNMVEESQINTIKVTTSNDSTNTNSMSMSRTMRASNGDKPLAVPGYLWIDLAQDIASDRFLGGGVTASVHLGSIINPSLMERVKYNKVAIKTYNITEETKHLLTVREFHYEVAIMNMLCHHPNIIEFTGYTDRNSFSIIMKYCEYSLHQIIFNQPHKILQPAIVLSLAIDICKGMNFIHQHEIVHLDLKPANILVDQSKPGEYVSKITDFGFATPIDSNPGESRSVRGLERSKVVGMTDAYAAPEYFDRISAIRSTCNPEDKFIDVFAFSVSFYEMINQRPSWQSVPVEEIRDRTRSGERPLHTNETLNRWANLPQLFELIKSCWDHLPRNRWSFAKCTNTLEDARKRLNQIN